MYDQGSARMNVQAAAFTQGSIGNNNSVPPQPTVSAEIITRLETLHSVLRNVADNQRNLLERLHGPRPANGQADTKSPIPNGFLQTIDERFGWLSSIASEITDNQNQLNRLA